MAEPVAAAWAQLLGLGLIWVGVHCAGMCGPLLVGLDVAGVTRGTSVPGGAARVLLYQLGRASTYAALGALAGTVGAGLGATFARAGSFITLGVGALLVLLLITRLVPRKARTAVHLGRRRDPLAARLSRRLLPLAGTGRPLDLVALGAVLGFLPCMITAWALGLAATTSSPLHGAGLMWTLVGLTTPALLGVTILPRLVTARLGTSARHVPTALMGVSAFWLTMVGLAGLGVVDHVHLPVGADLVVMLW